MLTVLGLGGSSTVRKSGREVALLLPKGTWIYLLYVNPAYRVGEFLVGVALAS